MGTGWVKDRFLAQIVPARTLPAGSNPVSKFNDWNGNIDMQARFKNGWPASRGNLTNWKHGDVKNVAYPYIYQLFDFIVENGGLRP